MSWTGTHRAKGQTDREYFEQEFPIGLTQHGRILECATVHNVFYAAVQNNDTAPSYAGITWCLVVLIQRDCRNRDTYFNFHYKELDDTMGPAEDRCPERILDLLSPTDHEFSTQWRERCREYHAERKAKGTIKKGETVRFTGPENLAGLGPLTRIDGRAGIFRRNDTGGSIRISWWRSATWETVS